MINDQPRVTPTMQIGMDDPRAVSQGLRSDPPPLMVYRIVRGAGARLLLPRHRQKCLRLLDLPPLEVRRRQHDAKPGYRQTKDDLARLEQIDDLRGAEQLELREPDGILNRSCHP